MSEWLAELFEGVKLDANDLGMCEAHTLCLCDLEVRQALRYPNNCVIESRLASNVASTVSLRKVKGVKSPACCVCSHSAT